MWNFSEPSSTDHTYYMDTTVTNSKALSCKPIFVKFVLIVLIIPILQVFINTVVIIAAIRSRATLIRNNFLYLYVVNMLLVNLMFGLLSIYTVANRVFVFEFTSDNHKIMNTSADTALKTWWGFRVAFVMNLYLAMCANVSSLIYGLRESSFFVGPGIVSPPERKKKRTIRHKKVKALVIILLTWLLPVILTFAEMVGWSCLDYCECFDAHYSDWENLCHMPGPQNICSKTIPPLTNFYLLTLSVFWLILCIVIGVMLFTTVRAYRSTLLGENEIAPAMSKREHEGSNTFRMSNSKNTDSETNQMNWTLKIEKIELEKFRNSRFKWKNMNYSLKLMILVSILFVVFSLPLVVIMVIGMTNETTGLTPEIIATAYMSTLLYCIMVPILLVYYLPSLRRSVVELLSLCTCCTETVILRGNTSKISTPRNYFSQ